MIVLFVPRLIRIMSPAVQIEDPNYIYGAFLLTLGQQPFLDFAQPNPPLLESIISVFYLIFGVSHRVPEILTGLAYFFTSLFIFRLGTRFFSKTAGTIAAVLFSYHFLVFRYHLFEREVFATLLFAAGFDLLTQTSSNIRNQILSGVLIGLGYACKQTALIPFLAVIFILFVFHRKFKDAIYCGVGFAGTILLMTGLYTFLYGDAYLRQTFWFHFIKGAVAPFYVKAVWTVSALGFLTPIALASLLIFRKDLKAPEWLLYFSGLSPVHSGPITCYRPCCH